MVALTENRRDKCSLNVNDEFEKYVMEQRTMTTFNGIEVAEFSWYKKILGLKS